MTDLGKQIEAARKQAGLTRLALANILSMDPQTVYCWERSGQRPTDLNLAAIAEACGCTCYGPQLILRGAKAPSTTE